jgi:CRP/FNR family transcriptional regulator, cyclic AMP receptor protein
MAPVISTTNKANRIAKETARILLKSALGFRDCADATLDALVDAGSLRVLRTGEVLARQGTPCNALCFVVRGSLESSLVRLDGHRHLIGFLLTGDVSGMVGIIDGRGHAYDVRSRNQETTVLLIPIAAITALKEIDGKLARALELQLAFRTRLLYDRLTADTSLPLESRLAHLLLTLSDLYGSKQEAGTQLEMKLSQLDLADWLGVSRQRMNAAVQSLRSQALIHFSYSRITVLDRAGLVVLADI